MDNSEIIKLKTLLNTIPDIVFELDAKGRFVFLGEAVKSLGYKPQELIGQHFKMLLGSEERKAAQRSLILPKYKGVNTGLENSPKLFDERRTKGRMTRDLELKIPIQSKSKSKKDYIFASISSSGKWGIVGKDKVRKLTGSIGIIREITKQKQKEDRQADFISTATHELRSPLATINQAVSILREGVAESLNPQDAKFFKMVDKNVKRLVHLVHDLLDISRLKSGRGDIKKSPLDVTPFIDDAIENFQLTGIHKGILFKPSLPKKLPLVLANESLFKQVLTNLLSNALRFAKKEVTISADITKPFVIFSVSDDGKGIKAEDLDLIFEKFAQVSRPTEGDEYKGTGLGLSICREIIESLGGKIWAESDATTGTKFRFSLPRI